MRRLTIREFVSVGFESYSLLGKHLEQKRKDKMLDILQTALHCIILYYILHFIPFRKCPAAVTPTNCMTVSA